jgi:hypothetical protein
LRSFTVTLALPVDTPLTVTTPLSYRAVATEGSDDDADTLPDAPVTRAVPDAPWVMINEVGLTLRLLLDELWELSSLLSSASAGLARNRDKLAQMSPLHIRFPNILNILILLLYWPSPRRAPLQI